MLSIQIDDLKKMTGLLFSEDAFDKFETYSVLLKTAYTTAIDGTQVPETDSDENAQSTSAEYVLWRDVRPVVYRQLQGKTLPKYFKIVLKTQKNVTEYIREKSGFNETGISSFSMNITYQKNELSLTTGVSYTGFTLDKSAEAHWDKTVRSFLDDKEVKYHE